MSTTLRIHCDGCTAQADDEFPPDWRQFLLLSKDDEEYKRIDVCPECWQTRVVCELIP